MLIALLILSNLLLLIALLWLGKNYLRQRDRRRGRKSIGSNPIPLVEPGAIDPRFALSRAQAPSLDSEVRFIGAGGTLGGTTDTEAWLLAGFAKSARQIFELGTCTGKTTYLFAANAPNEAEIVTITLPPDGNAAGNRVAGDDMAALETAHKESQVSEFYYANTPEGRKITQLFGDSKEFDHEPYRGRFDLIFIDGGHAASYVRSDSEKALAMLAPGGLLLWHDYTPSMTGVWDTLNALHQSGVPLQHIRNTTLVAHRAI